MLVLIVIIAIAFSSFGIARKIYLRQTSQNNKWALTVGIITFVGIFSSLTLILIIILLNSIHFSR